MTSSRELTTEDIEALERITKGFVARDGFSWRQGGEDDRVFTEASATIWGGDPEEMILDCSDHDCGPELAAALVAMRNAFPALLTIAKRAAQAQVAP